MDNEYHGETEHRARLEAERVIERIDRILVDNTLKLVSNPEALRQIAEVVSAWTDPKEEAR